MKKKKADATWQISCDVHCPECEHYFDLIDYNREGLPHPLETIDNYDLEVTCPKCNSEFIVDMIQY